MRQAGVGPLPTRLRPELAPELAEAVELYNMMGGLDWTALPVMFGLYGVRDPEATIVRLAIIRDALGAPRDRKSGTAKRS